MIQVLEKAESSLLSGFNYQFSELEKRYIEAKDNVKFLTTLERHFKHITNGTLVQILDTLPSMMNALRMVWVISRHYKEDHRMEPLMARIAWEVANRVSTMINMRTIFREPAAWCSADAGGAVLSASEERRSSTSSSRAAAALGVALLLLPTGLLTRDRDSVDRRPVGTGGGASSSDDMRSSMRLAGIE